MSDRSIEPEPDPEPDPEVDPEPEPGPLPETDELGLDTSGEPEPDWAEGIRRGRRDRAARLRRLLGDPTQTSEEPPT
jgi:hypothetical protein